MTVPTHHIATGVNRGRTPGRRRARPTRRRRRRGSCRSGSRRRSRGCRRGRRRSRSAGRRRAPARARGRRPVDVVHYIVEERVRTRRVEVVHREHHDAGQPVAVHVVSAHLNGLCRFAAVPVITVVEVGGIRDRVEERVGRIGHDIAYFLVHRDAGHGTRVGHGWRSTGRRHVKTVITARLYTRPTPVVEGDSQGQFVGGKPAGDAIGGVTFGPGFDGVVDGVVLLARRNGVARVVRRLEQRVLKVGRRVPVEGTVHVVGHDVAEVEDRSDLVSLNELDFVLTARQCRRQVHLAADRGAVRVEFGAKLLQQCGEVGRVVRAVVVAEVASARARVLPVDVDPVEQPRDRARTAVARRVFRQVALDEHVDAGAHERLSACIGRCRVGEIL